MLFRSIFLNSKRYELKIIYRSKDLLEMKDWFEEKIKWRDREMKKLQMIDDVGIFVNEAIFREMETL